MNSIENYKSIVEYYFGSGAVTFDATKGKDNNIIGALNHMQFNAFKLAFHKRLERLAARYKGDSNLTNLLLAVNEVGSEKNWEGAYAELVAFDFLNSDTDLLMHPISLSRTVQASDTLAVNLGMTNVNFDGYYDDFGVYFDVKVLSDKSEDILDGIISEAKQQLGISDATIRPEYPLDLDFGLFEEKRAALCKELTGAIDIKAKTLYVKSIILPELNYRIMWGSGVLTSVGTYDPFQHAANHHTLLFKHAKKFSTTSPCLIVFVIFPWFSEKFLSLVGSNETFYRAFCRRFFCQYAKDCRKAKDVLKGFQGDVTMADVTNKLSGVLFLEDVSIESIKSDSQNVKAFAYLNPNASHKIGHIFQEYLRNLVNLIDDFENDNY